MSTAHYAQYFIGRTVIVENGQPRTGPRDARTISHHAFAGLGRCESCGQVRLGLQSDWPFFHLWPFATRDAGARSVRG